MSRTEKLTAYYQQDRDGDLKSQIRTLKDKKGSRFEGRSESEILRILIKDKLHEVLGNQSP
jgi:hypothetical protein